MVARENALRFADPSMIVPNKLEVSEYGRGSLGMGTGDEAESCPMLAFSEMRPMCGRSTPTDRVRPESHRIKRRPCVRV